jgi:hypothetical protein
MDYERVLNLLEYIKSEIEKKGDSGEWRK